ncbi:MAG: hypothetical protein IKQ76_07080 [Bacteroidales bacterium]|jgi:hypothetical protein|nr:hypothetical protein [Bacteroidales bacterium]
MNRFVPLFLLLAATSCGSLRRVAEVDSTRVEVRTEVKTIHDTAWMELPVIVERVATLDTASVLENKYARSEASVSGGILSHSLETKPVKQPVAVESREIVRDSIVFRDRVIQEDIYIEKQLNGWQKFRLRLGDVSLILIAIAILYLLFNKLNLFKL